MGFLLRLADAVDAATRLFGRLATAILLLLIALVGWNVFGRYIIGTSPIALQEAEWHLLAVVALLGISVLMLEKGHVRVDMLYDRLPVRWQHGLDLVSMIVGVVVSVLFVKYSAGFVGSAWSIREGSPDPGGIPGRYVLKAVIPAGFVLFGLQCAANAIRHAAALSGREG